MALTSVCWRTLWEKDCAVKIFSILGRTVFPFIFPKIYCANLFHKWFSNTIDYSLKSIFFLYFNLRRYTCFRRFLYNFVSFFFFNAALGKVLTQPRPLVIFYFSLKKLEVCINMSAQEVERFPWAYQHAFNSLLLFTAFFVVILVRVLSFFIALYWGVLSQYNVFYLKMRMQIMPYFPLKLYISIASCAVAGRSPH